MVASNKENVSKTLDVSEAQSLHRIAASLHLKLNADQVTRQQHNQAMCRQTSALRGIENAIWALAIVVGVCTVAICLSL